MTIEDVEVTKPFQMPDFSGNYEGDKPDYTPLRGWNVGTIVPSYFSVKKQTTYELGNTVDADGRNRLLLPIQFENKTARDGKEMVFVNLIYTVDDLEAATSIPKASQGLGTSDLRLWFLRAAIAGLTKAVGHPLTFTGVDGNSHIDPKQFANQRIGVNLQADPKDANRTKPNGFNPFRPASQR